MTDDWFERALQEEEAGDGNGVEKEDEEETEDGEASTDEASVNDATEDETTTDKSALDWNNDDWTGGTDDQFGGNEAGTGLFDDDFATMFEGAGGPDGVAGFGENEPTFESLSGSSAEQTFDDAKVDSDIPRIKLGIDGLDEMIQGGVPERSLIAAIGGAGTGKTTFGLQFLNEALEAGERAIFITLEQRYDDIINTAIEMGWSFDVYVEEGDLAIVDLDPIEMANSLSSIRNEMSRLVSDFGASRLVLDSVSLLEMMYEHRATRRNEIYDFTHSLKASGVTALLTSEASQETPYASRYGIVEYLTDAVFVLRFIRHSDFQETSLAVEIQKIRNANHSRETKPYEITNAGISVYRQANIF